MVEVWLGSNLAERMIEVVQCLSGTDMLGDLNTKNLAAHSFILCHAGTNMAWSIINVPWPDLLLLGSLIVPCNMARII
jgi:hypothetical protein